MLHSKWAGMSGIKYAQQLFTKTKQKRTEV